MSRPRATAPIGEGRMSLVEMAVDGRSQGHHTLLCWNDKTAGGNCR
jgi:hypothetical protein